MTQPSLFDAPARVPVGSSSPAQARRLSPAVRKSDPRTSHAAAASMSDHVLSKQRTEVLRVIRAMEGTCRPGATAWDVARSIGIQQSVAARRCTDLVELGLIRDSGRTRPGSSNRELIVWEPAS